MVCLRCRKQKKKFKKKKMRFIISDHLLHRNRRTKKIKYFACLNIRQRSVGEKNNEREDYSVCDVTFQLTVFVKSGYLINYSITVTTIL